jgi:16S rRNA (cytidine1402-2'-O)-methyltransferase
VAHTPGTGTLVLVATPIGNLGDVSARAVETLRTADAIACEDTRRMGRLLQHLGIPREQRLVVANEHTEAAAARQVVALLATGATVAVVTDAGTPGVSDPAERLVRAALGAGHTVTTVPGPVAAVAALVVSGLATDRFVVEGFLPRSGPERRRRVADVASEPRTVVLYEAPHRLARTLTELAEACGPDRPVAVARELTKLHEEVWRGTLGEAVARSHEVEPRGEHVLVLAGRPAPAAPTADDLDTALHEALSGGASVKDAAASVAEALALPRRQVYERALALRHRS